MVDVLANLQFLHYRKAVGRMGVMGEKILYTLTFMLVRVVMPMPVRVLFCMMMRYKGVPKHNNACDEAYYKSNRFVLHATNVLKIWNGL
jgi:hypothetical protein